MLATAASHGVESEERGVPVFSGFNLDEALTRCVERGGTDLHIRAYDYPIFRLHGKLVRDEGYPVFTPEDTHKLGMSIIKDHQLYSLEESGDCDLSYAVDGVSRFRVNVFYERDNIGIAFRTIPENPPKLEVLGVPSRVLQEIATKPRGFFLVTGPTGSGKTTTLAAMLDYINENSARNIITIEDPIEYRHRNKLSVISQREIGKDSSDFSRALRSALRQDPDVILVGELRDLETISIALTAAETGHLVLGTLHTNSATSSVDRIVDIFPPHQQDQVRLQLSMNLQGILCQALLPGTAASGGRRVVACEILVATHGIRNLIREAKTHQIPTAMEAGGKWGMTTLDMDLKRLVQQGQISIETALAVARHPEEFHPGKPGIDY
ncbi:type IV pilus twitching motility protein PilT [bacterium]|nr:type IV pilus twitching motility protein PilT [bacterium]